MKLNLARVSWVFKNEKRTNLIKFNVSSTYSLQPFILGHFGVTAPSHVIMAPGGATVSALDPCVNHLLKKALNTAGKLHVVKLKKVSLYTAIKTFSFYDTIKFIKRAQSINLVFKIRCFEYSMKT